MDTGVGSVTSFESFQCHIKGHKIEDDQTYKVTEWVPYMTMGLAFARGSIGYSGHSGYASGSALAMASTVYVPFTYNVTEYNCNFEGEIELNGVKPLKSLSMARDLCIQESSLFEEISIPSTCAKEASQDEIFQAGPQNLSDSRGTYCGQISIEEMCYARRAQIFKNREALAVSQSSHFLAVNQTGS